MPKKERKLIDPDGDWGSTQSLRKEWVDLDIGSLCVWELTVAESMQILQRSSRPPKMAEVTGSPIDQEVMAAWQIIYSCHKTDAADSPRVFGDQHYLKVLALPFADYGQIIQAFNRVNGVDAEEEAKLRDFTHNGEGDSISHSTSGALKTSVASPKN